MTIASGTKLGSFEIVSPIGAGGMGEVWRARDAKIGRDVAIKVLPGSLLTDAGRLQRFEQEARAAGTLNHPNLVTIYELGTHAGAPFIAMELLEGETLRDKLERGAIPARKSIEYAVQIANGLAAAHEKGIVHRDLEPENIFAMPDGRIKILDFRPRNAVPRPARSWAPPATCRRSRCWRSTSITVLTSSRSAPSSTRCSPGIAPQARFVRRDDERDPEGRPAGAERFGSPGLRRPSIGSSAAVSKRTVPSESRMRAISPSTSTDGHFHHRSLRCEHLRDLPLSAFGWSSDSRSLFVSSPGELPIRIQKLDVASGALTPWKEIIPSEAAKLAATGFHPP